MQALEPGYQKLLIQKMLMLEQHVRRVQRMSLRRGGIGPKFTQAYEVRVSPLWGFRKHSVHVHANERAVIRHLWSRGTCTSYRQYHHLAHEGYTTSVLQRGCHGN